MINLFEKKHWVKLGIFASLALGILITPISAMAETTVSDKDWRVTFTSDKKMESNFRTADIDEAVYGMQPGDNMIIAIKLGNENKDETDWYMTNEVLSSLEDSVKVAKGAAYSYILTYTNSKGEETVLFSSDTVGGDMANGSDQGLHEATTALKDYFYLDTLKNGEAGIIKLEVLLEGETQGNMYQDTLADLQMNFAVELRDDRNVTIVRTGDDTNIMVFVICGLLGLVLLVLVIVSRIASKASNSSKEKKEVHHE